MERVEQKVRIQLHPQHVQSRPHQFGGQCRSLRFALAIPPVIMPPEMRQHDHPINDHRDVTVINNQFPEHAAKLKRGAVDHRFLAVQQPGVNGEVNERHQHRRAGVKDEPAFGAFPFQIQAARQPQDPNAEKRPGIPFFESAPEGQAPGKRVVLHDELGSVILRRFDNGHQRPEAENQSVLPRATLDENVEIHGCAGALLASRGESVVKKGSLTRHR